MAFVDDTQVKHIFIICGKTDLRRGIDGLMEIVTLQYQLDAYKDAVFLFCGTRRERYKALYRDGDGFLLLYKRIESGKLQWPRDSQVARQLTYQQVRWLLEGLSIDQTRVIGPAPKVAYF